MGKVKEREREMHELLTMLLRDRQTVVLERSLHRAAYEKAVCATVPQSILQGACCVHHAAQVHKRVDHLTSLTHQVDADAVLLLIMCRVEGRGRHDECTIPV